MSIATTLHQISQAYTKALVTAESPLTETQILILDALVAHPGASQTVLVNATRIDRSTLADVMRRLFKAKLVYRQRSRSDARAYTIEITDNGREALAKAKRARRVAERTILDQYPALKGLAA